MNSGLHVRVLSQLSGGAIQLSDANYPDGNTVLVELIIVDHS